MNIYPQASNGAPDTSMSEVCTSVLFESSIQGQEIVIIRAVE